MELFEKLYELRRGASLSQEELAEKLCVSRQAVSKWENGSATPEVSKLIELSRLYGVSVDELLSLERETAQTERDAAPQDAPEQKHAESPDGSPRRRRLLAGALALLLALGLFAAGAAYARRLRALNAQVSSLQSQVQGLQNSIAGQIGGISASVQSILEREASLISLYDSEVESLDLRAKTCTLRFSLMPKTVTDGLSITLQLTGKAFETCSLPLEKDSFEAFRGSITVPLDDEIDVAALLDSGTEKKVQQLDTLSGLLSDSSPKLYPPFLFTYSYGSSAGDANYHYRFHPDGPEYSNDTLSLGGLAEQRIKSACLEYLVGGEVLGRVPLLSEKLDELQWYASGSSGTFDRGAHYSLQVNGDVEFEVPAGSTVDARVRVELDDGVLLYAVFERHTLPEQTPGGFETKSLFEGRSFLPFEIVYP